MLNFDLLKSPLNWLIILLMVVSAALMIDVIRQAVIKAAAKVASPDVPTV